MDKNDLSEMYWLLDEVLEKLNLIKQLPYEIYETHEKLLLFGVLSLSGIVNNEAQIRDLIKKIEEYKWSTPENTMAFYLGILSRNYLKRKHNLLSDIDELNKCFNNITSKVNEFCKENSVRKIVDALFIQAVFIDLMINMLNITLARSSTTVKTLKKITKKLLMQISELSLDHRIKILYSLSVLHEFLEIDINKNWLMEFSKGLASNINKVSIEYRAFMLKALTILRMLPERQAVLKSLTEEYRRRLLHTLEKDLVRKLVTALSTRNSERISGIRFTDQGRGIITLEIELLEEQMQAIASPNVIQLCLLALGLIISGYHKSYTLPFHEQDNYIRINETLRKYGEEISRTRLRIIDIVKHDLAVHDFLKEKIWPILRNNLILWNIILVMLIIFLLLNIGLIWLTLGILGGFLLTSSILKKVLEVSLQESFKLTQSLFRESYKESVIERLKEDLYKRISRLEVRG